MRLPLIAAYALAACSSAAVAGPVPFVLQPGHIDLERGPDGNTVILDAPQGLIVVDTGRHPDHAARIVDHARKVGKPVVAVVNTHWHLDHTTGNRDVLSTSPEAFIVASGAVEGALDGFLARSADQARKALADPKQAGEAKDRTRRALAAIEDQAALIPGMKISRTTTGKLGGRRVEFHLARNAATQGDLWLVLPDEKLAVVGDLVVAPFPFFDTGCEQGWSDALAEIARAKWTTLIPGHGQPMGRADFSRWRSAFTAVLDCAKSSREIGRAHV